MMLFSAGESVNDWQKHFGENGPPEFGYKLFGELVVRQFGATVSGGDVFLARFRQGQAFTDFPRAWVCGNSNHPSSLAAPATKDHHSPLVCSMVYYGRISWKDRFKFFEFTDDQTPRTISFSPTRRASKNLHFQGQDSAAQFTRFFFPQIFFCWINQHVPQKITYNFTLQSVTFHNFWPLFWGETWHRCCFCLGLYLVGSTLWSTRNGGQTETGGKWGKTWMTTMGTCEVGDET